MSQNPKNFDAAALSAAFAANQRAATVQGQADPADLADAGLQAAAAELGLDRDAANALMAECLRAAVTEPDADPQWVRKQKVPAWIAVGMAFGYLARMRAERDAAEPIDRLQAALDGMRFAADNTKDPKTASELRGVLATLNGVENEFPVPTEPDPEPMGGG